MNWNKHSYLNISELSSRLRRSADYNMLSYSSDNGIVDTAFSIEGDRLTALVESGTAPVRITLDGCIVDLSESGRLYVTLRLVRGIHTLKASCTGASISVILIAEGIKESEGLEFIAYDRKQGELYFSRGNIVYKASDSGSSSPVLTTVNDVVINSLMYRMDCYISAIESGGNLTLDDCGTLISIGPADSSALIKGSGDCYYRLIYTLNNALYLIERSLSGLSEPQLLKSGVKRVVEIAKEAAAYLDITGRWNALSEGLDGLITVTLNTSVIPAADCTLEGIDYYIYRGGRYVNRDTQEPIAYADGLFFLEDKALLITNHKVRLIDKEELR